MEMHNVDGITDWTEVPGLLDDSGTFTSLDGGWSKKLAEDSFVYVLEVDGAPFAWTDGAAVDLFGDPVELPDADDARVCLLHPTRLDSDELELWREHARERKAVAPFAQLYRDVLPPGDDPFVTFAGREAYAEQVAAMARVLRDS